MNILKVLFYIIAVPATYTGTQISRYVPKILEFKHTGELSISLYCRLQHQQFGP